MIGNRSWSQQQWLITFGVALLVWLVYAFIGPGADYFGCYTWMVTEPERLPLVSERVWTLNPPWLVPFMAPFVSLPGRAGYLAFMLANLAMTIYGTYVLGGRPLPILLSAHMMWILWWGQIEGWGILAIAIAWFAWKASQESSSPKSWLGMYLALLLATFKPQIGFAPVAALWWWSGKERWKSLAALLITFLLSLLIWGPWPIWYAQGVLKFVGDEHAGPWNASLGMIALPLFLPALLVPLEREKRLIALTATAYLASPYLPYYSTIALLSFAVPAWAYIFGFTAYLPSVLGTRLAWNSVMLLPALVLLWIYWPVARAWWQRRNAKASDCAAGEAK